MDIVVWLRSLGLGKYEAIFRDNDIDEAVLPRLTHQNLKAVVTPGIGLRRVTRFFVAREVFPRR
jgi:hypothetical protein